MNIAFARLADLPFLRVIIGEKQISCQKTAEGQPAFPFCFTHWIKQLDELAFIGIQLKWHPLSLIIETLPENMRLDHGAC